MMPKVSPNSSLKNGPNDAVRKRAREYRRFSYAPGTRYLGPRRRRRVLQIDEDRGLSGRGVAAHEIEMRRFLQLFLDPSVTCLTVSSTVAPGQPSATTIVLEGEGRIFVATQPQEGQAPATIATIIRNMTSERLVIAHSDRFGPIISRPRAGGLLARPQCCTPAVTITSPGDRP